MKLRISHILTFSTSHFYKVIYRLVKTCFHWLMCPTWLPVLVNPRNHMTCLFKART